MSRLDTYSAADTYDAGAVVGVIFEVANVAGTSLITIRRVWISLSDDQGRIVIAKRNLAPAGGAPIALPEVPHDVISPASAATARSFGTAATGAGLIGEIGAFQLGTTAPANFGILAHQEWGTTPLDVGIVLRDAEERLSIEKVTAGAVIVAIAVEWTEG